MTTEWGLFDRPELLDSVTLPQPGGWREALIAVDGVRCGGCVRGVERALGPEVRDVRVNITSRTVGFRFAPVAVKLSQLLQQLQQAGYQPQVLSQDAGIQGLRTERRTALARLGVAVICAMQVMMLAWPDYFDAGAVDPGIHQLLRWAQWLVATPAVLYSGWPFLDSAWRQLRNRAPGMDVPVAASILIAYAASAWRTVSGEGAVYFDAATMFVMLLGAGRYLEGRSRALAGERLRSLAGRRPLTTTRLHQGVTETVAVSLLVPGDRLRIHPGEAVPVDGVLLEAEAELDESLLTGESRPVRRSAGSPLLAGSLNAGIRPLELRATGVGETTRLAAITRLLHQAHADKPAAQLLADRIAGKFVAAVLLLATLAASYWWPVSPDHALNAVLAVLIVSCPCALSLAIPAVYAAASSRLAQSGVLLTRTAALARLPQVSHVLFDKTGTLTRNALSVDRVQLLGPLPRDRCIAIAAALERDLRHPIARAIAALDGSSQATLLEQRAGGIRGTVDGERYWIGAPEFAPETPAALLETTHPGTLDTITQVLLFRGGQALALFGLRAHPRPEAAAVVRTLNRDGLSVSLLTGDAEAPARHLATQCSIHQLFWRQTPEQKLQRQQTLQRLGAVVMAVGDGINDAPLLAAADVGVAMPGGAALAQARADVILTGDDLSGLLLLRQVAQLAARRVRENLAWALGYNLLMLPLAFSGQLTPWLAALGMSLSSLLVVANALRVAPRPDTEPDAAPTTAAEA